jgi:osmotically-inducible protein OsmY
MAKRYENRYGRGGHRRDREYADDRGYMDRAGDEVRSWFGDDDAERRRHMDEERDRREGNWNRSDSRSNWNSRDWDDRVRAGWNRPENWRESSSRYWEREADEGRRQDHSRSWSSQDSRRDDADYWRGVRESRGPDYVSGSEYGGGSDYGRSAAPARDLGYGQARYRSSGNWSVDDGRTEFGRQHWGRGPKGYQRSDNRILEDVCDRLMYSEVDAGDIEVRVENGEVTLTGSVRDRSDKRRAEDIVEEVSGVRDVHNNIRVHHPDRGIGQSETSTSDQPGTVLGVNPTSSSTITNERPKAKTNS